jgi:hypothetical protein
VEKCGRDGEAMDDNVAHARCMLDNKCTDTYSKYVIIIAFPQQQWLRERVRMLRYSTVSILLTLLGSFVGLPDRMQLRSNGSTVSSASTLVPLTQKKDYTATGRCTLLVKGEISHRRVGCYTISLTSVKTQSGI